MKKIYIFCLLVLVSPYSFAQLNMGLKINWAVNNFVFKTAEGERISRSSMYQNINPGNDFLFTLSGGAMANYKLNHRFSIQSELILNTAKTGFTETLFYTDSQGEQGATVNSFNVNMQYLEIPILAKMSFGKKVTFDVMAGGFAGYLLSAKQSTETGTLEIIGDTIPSSLASTSINYPTHNVISDYTKFNAGVLLGCSVTMRDRLVFEIRLNRGLVNINKTNDVKINTLQGQFTVGWYLFRQKAKAANQ